MAHSKFTPTGLNSHNHLWFQSFLMPLLKFNRIISCSLFERGNQNNLWLQGHILSIISSKPKQYISGFYFEVFFYLLFWAGCRFFLLRATRLQQKFANGASIRRKSFAKCICLKWRAISCYLKYTLGNWIAGSNGYFSQESWSMVLVLSSFSNKDNLSA